MKAGRKLLIIAEEIEGDALTGIIVNKLRGTFTCVCVKAPGFGDRRKEMLEDIAILTGGQVVSAELGMQLDDFDVNNFGTARQVKITKDNTIIIDGAGDSKDIKDRVEAINLQMKDSTSDYDKDKYNERIAKLAGGVAVIKVGAETETEMKEKKLRIEDALNATRAAVEEGIVAGGGTAYVMASLAAEKLLSELEGDERTGAALVVKALQAPIRQIAENAGLEGAVVLERVKQSKDINFGFNAATEEYVNMLDAGIVDPTKVCRSAIQNAASVSAMVLTTESLVADIPEPPVPNIEMGGGMGGGMGGMF